MNDVSHAIDSFLTSAGWGGAKVDPIPGDASFRRYFRVTDCGRQAMVMFAPPPAEDPLPFLNVAQWLAENGHRSPAIYAADAESGWVLHEDFGDDRMRDWLDTNPGGEVGCYKAAIDALVQLHASPAGPFAPYDLAVYQREAALLIECYCPAMGLVVDERGYSAAWDAALAPMIERQARNVTVLRDYHAENIMLLSPAADGTGAQGLIDFQDALVGNPAYDLVSLLQDARRDVNENLEQDMRDYYLGKVDQDSTFEADYALVGAQRNAKIIGIFTRLYKRDGKPHYLSLIPRVWEAMERDLNHLALAPVARWFDANIPQAIRDAKGGQPQ